MHEHKRKINEGFSCKYNLTRLVWYAQGNEMSGAVAVEKKIKNRSRQWKIDLVERTNPEWRDLSIEG
jgi:putative endonuclease